MPEQVAAEVKARRAEALRELDVRLRQRFLESRLGEPVEALVERIEGGVAEGTTREYLRVRFPAGDAVVGEAVDVVLGADMVV
jgi:tRNA A37 methylthiotransferase MiaB